MTLLFHISLIILSLYHNLMMPETANRVAIAVSPELPGLLMAIAKFELKITSQLQQL
jgi:hypothetical protein